MLVCDKCGAREAAISAEGVKREAKKVEKFAFSMDPKSCQLGAANMIPPVDLCQDCREQLRAMLKAAVEAFLKPPPLPGQRGQPAQTW